MAEPDRKRGPRQKRWLVLSAVVVLALVFLIPFIQEGGARVDTSVEVETASAVTGAIEQSVTGSGVAVSAASTEVTAPCAGTLASVAVEEGGLVEEGDVLAVYDGDSLRAQLDAAMDRIDELDALLDGWEEALVFSVTAPADGRVCEIAAARGDRIEDVLAAGGSLMVLSSDGLLRLELASDGLEEGMELTLSAQDGREAVTVVHAIEPSEDGQEERAVLLLEDDGTFRSGETVELRDAEGRTVGTAEVGYHEPIEVTAESGLVSRVEVETGDWVSEGDVLLTCTASSSEALALLEERAALVERMETLRAALDQPELRAPASGRVSGLAMEAGAAVEAGAPLCTVSSTHDFTLEATLPDSALDQVRAGQTAKCSFDEMTYTGTVTLVTAPDEAQGAEGSVTIHLPSAEGVQIGDVCAVRVILGREEEAVLVPIEAVQVEHLDTYLVRVSYGDGLTQLVEVEIGLQDGEQVQITEGLRAGDQVVVASRVVETTVFSFFNFEWIIDQQEGQSEESALSEAEDVTVVEEGEMTGPDGTDQTAP